ncbi:protocadherin Fat 4-like [Liolophura sinensis]|uniref:protocadherin Fat 4-like n=1 Tax=Liolophura sinensis TaxID=3198878 RepID=UPI0031584DE3
MSLAMKLQFGYKIIHFLRELNDGARFQRGREIHSTTRDSGEVVYGNVAPTCTPDFVTVGIPEDTAVTSPVASPTCTDGDAGADGTMTFSFTSGNTGGEFLINGASGAVTLNSALDYETKVTYTLEIRVADGGVPPLDTTFTVYVQVTPVNEFDPVITSPNPVISNVKESSLGVIITTVAATDDDDGRDGELRYDITDGNDGKFHIDSITGGLYAIQPLDYETTKSYSLEVEVVDLSQTAPRTATTTVTINLKNVNEFYPTCAALLYTEMKEDSDMNRRHGIVARVGETCSDPDDDGSRRYPFTYRRRSINDYLMFNMHSYGNFRLSVEIDPDTEKNVYYQEVYVTEFGISPKLWIRVGVVLKMIGVDDNPTIWPSLLMDLELSENQAPGQNVLMTLQATDGDPPNTPEGHLEYGLASQPNPEQFIVHPDGNLYLIKPLDRETDATIVLNVHVVTKYKPSDLIPATITITVTDINDNVPSFDQPMYYASVAEGTDYSVTPIATVVASDPDLGLNGTVTYNIIGGNPSGLFVIDMNSGVVTTPLPLDYDSMQKSFQLTIQAEDGGSPALSSTILLIVDIEPVNEDDPVIYGSLDATVSEGDGHGVVVFIFNVSDLDAGPDGMISFTGLTDLYPFALNRDSGEITLVGPVDREITPAYNLEILVSDKSQSSPRSVTTTVSVTLVDENDNSPVCDPVVHVEISTLDGAGSEVVQLNCDDADIGANGDLDYVIVSGNDNGDLTVDTNGKVVLVKPAGLQKYTVDITVQDKGSPALNTSVTLLIDVTVHPLVTNLPAVLNIPENTSVSTFLFQINSTSIEPLYYDLISVNEAGYFVLGRSTGKLYLANALDKETLDYFYMVVQVIHARTGLSTYGNITIIVDDVNDHSPTFSNSFNNIKVTENIALGTEIIDLDVSDLDKDAINRQISYTIKSGNSGGKFAIDINGKLTVNGLLNYEEKSLYQLEIEANDNAPLGSLIAITKVIVEVVNQDEFPAVFNFSASNNTVWIAEDFAIAGVILELNATDLDGNIIVYDFLSADTSVFEIDARGRIYLVKSLDREVLDNYDLVVRASNPTGLSSTATVKIIVTDVNDNEPQFGSSVSATDVLESSPVGTTLINLTCSDRDIQDNAKLTFTIIAGNGAGHFRLDGLQLVTNDALNFDRESHYKLVVEAVDQGIPSRSATTVITVQVLQTAIPPNFLPNIDTVSVFENTAAGTEFYDADATSLGAHEDANGTIQYSILSGNSADTFAIALDSGKIVLTGPVDADNGIDSYQLVIQAVSKLDSSLTDTLILNVTIDDVNDNKPVFSQTQYTDVVVDGSTTGTSVLTVIATDVDRGMNSQISYSLSGIRSADFTISSVGEVVVANTIDFNFRDRYTLTVHATDAGVPALTAEAILILTVHSDQNTAPSFSSSSVRVSIAEDIGVGTLVSKLVATDPDSGANGNLVYNIMAGDPAGMFGIGLSDGAVDVFQALDRETQDFYQLQITCADRGTPSLSATIYLNINITDVNDNNPLFVPTSYSASTTSDVNVGYQVGQVTASDIDLGFNAVITYSIISGNGGNLFAIDPYTGVVSINGDLAAALGSHILTIQAKDSGTSPGLSTTTFTVTVTNTPNYSFKVLENQASGTLVGSLTEPGSVTYTVVSGDVAREFYISSPSGEIRTSTPLDREQVPVYTLTVLVEEIANPANWYNLLVTVTVDDDNDHDPVFSQSSYTVQVMEGSPTDFSVFRIPVSDGDEGPNANIDLVIVDGISDAVFKVSDATGEVFVKTPPKYADRTSYDVQIRAIDGGAPPRSSDTVVRVRIIESLSVQSSVCGVGEALFLSLECSSADTSGRVLYTLTRHMFNFNSSNITNVEFFTLQTSNSPFLVDKVTGELRVSNDGLIFTESKYIFWVVANAFYTDGSKESRQGMVRVDTFDPSVNIIEVTLKVPNTDLSANGTSTVLVYGVRSTSTDSLTNLNSAKPFMSEGELLALYQAVSDGTPVPPLTTGNGTVLSVMGYFVEPKAAEVWHETTTGIAIIAIVCICIFILILAIVLYVLCTRSSKKK